MDVGGLRRGTKSIQVKKSHSEASPEAVTREGADEMTSRAEEVGSLRTFIDTKHIKLERGPLVDVDWHAFRQAIHKGFKGKEWKASCYRYRE